MSAKMNACQCQLACTLTMPYVRLANAAGVQLIDPPRCEICVFWTIFYMLESEEILRLHADWKLPSIVTALLNCIVKIAPLLAISVAVRASSDAADMREVGARSRHLALQTVIMAVLGQRADAQPFVTLKDLVVCVLGAVAGRLRSSDGVCDVP